MFIHEMFQNNNQNETAPIRVQVQKTFTQFVVNMGIKLKLYTHIQKTYDNFKQIKNDEQRN